MCHARIVGEIASGAYRVKPRFDFSLCNPPFYASTEEATQSAAAKELLPNAVRSTIPTIPKTIILKILILYSHQICTGADVEMITPGGEEAFVRKMVEESITLRQRCRHVPFSIYLVTSWFASLFFFFTDGTPPWSASNRLSRLSLRSSALTRYALKCLAAPSVHAKPQIAAS